MQNRELNFRVFAREACPIIDVPAGETVFHMGEPGATMIQTLANRVRSTARALQPAFLDRLAQNFIARR